MSEMTTRVLVCGSRDLTDRAFVWRHLDTLHAEHPIGLVIHGAANGADGFAMAWAIDRGLWHLPFPADWDHCDADCRPEHRRQRANGVTYCPSAGPRRNRQMMREGRPETVVAFLSKPLNQSRGTADMCRVAEAAGITPLIFLARSADESGA